MKRLTIAALLPAIAVIAALSLVSSASAYDHGHFGHHGRVVIQHRAPQHAVRHLGHGHVNHSLYPSTHVRLRYPTWHNTTHWDYHPSTFVQHGNHFHFQQGHLHLHQSGHFHR